MKTLRRPIAIVVFALGALIGPDPASARAAAPAASEATADTAVVEIDSRALFNVRGVSAFPAEDRARKIVDRIVQAARDRSVTTDSLRLEEVEFGTQILAGDRPLLLVTDEDAETEGFPRAQLASVFVMRIREAIAAYRLDREPRQLWRRAAYSGGATLLLIVLLAMLRWSHRHVAAGLERRYKDRVGGLKIQSVEFIQTERIWSLVSGAFRLIHLIVLLALSLGYLDVVLSLLPWTRGIAEGLLGYALDPLQTMGAGLVGFIPEALFLLVLILVTWYLLKAIRYFATGLALGTATIQGFDPEWTWPTYKIVRLLVVLFAIVVAYPYIPGSDSMAFKGVSLFVGVLFSLGSSSVIGNLVAGYSMTYRRAYRVGDRIRVNDVIGEVLETRVMVTHLRSPKNEEIIIPNSLIMSSTVINYSSIARKGGLILHTTVGIGYEVPWRQVEAMLLLAAERTPGLLKAPKPFVEQLSLGDFAVNYELNVYTDRPQEMRKSYAELHRNVLDVFNEYGVQIMTPAYEGDPEQLKVVPKDAWHAAPAPPSAPRSEGA